MPNAGAERARCLPSCRASQPGYTAENQHRLYRRVFDIPHVVQRDGYGSDADLYFARDLDRRSESPQDIQ